MDDSNDKKEPNEENTPETKVLNDAPAGMNNDALAPTEDEAKDIDFILNLPLELTVEYGRTRKKIGKLLDLQKGAVIELAKLKGEPVDILANGKLIAKGKVIVEDDKYAIKITEIINRIERIKKL